MIWESRNRNASQKRGFLHTLEWKEEETKRWRPLFFGTKGSLFVKLLPSFPDENAWLLSIGGVRFRVWSKLALPITALIYKIVSAGRNATNNLHPYPPTLSCFSEPKVRTSFWGDELMAKAHDFISWVFLVSLFKSFCALIVGIFVLKHWNCHRSNYGTKCFMLGDLAHQWRRALYAHSNREFHVWITISCIMNEPHSIFLANPGKRNVLIIKFKDDFHQFNQRFILFWNKFLRVPTGYIGRPKNEGNWCVCNFNYRDV